MWRTFWATSLIASLLFVQTSGAAPAIDQPAPDFVLRTLEHKNLRLSEFRGEVVIVNFWATWCGPCQQELPRLNALHERYARAGLITLGVNLDDDTDRARSMVQRLAVSFPMLLDQTKEVARLYGLGSMPLTIFIDREGVVRHVQETFRTENESVYMAQIHRLLDE